MVIVLKQDALKKDVGTILETMGRLGLQPRIISPGPRVVLGVVEDMSGELAAQIRIVLSGLACIESMETFGTSWKLASLAFRELRTSISVGSHTIGNGTLAVIAGPCAVESREMLIKTAQSVRASGANFLRGGAFKPRSSPYSFRGLGEEGLKYLAEASRMTGMPVITEVLSPEDVPLVARYADVLQIGARNMQNFTLLEAVGDQDKPVFLKRGLMATIKELLLSAEYVLARGNPHVILCERGIRTFEKETRNTLDISAVPLLKQLSHLPVVVDPSHAVGKHELVTGVALAAIAAGADGLMIEVHPDPEAATSDGRQSLTFEQFAELMRRAAKVSEAVGTSISGGSNGSGRELLSARR